MQRQNHLIIITIWFSICLSYSTNSLSLLPAKSTSNTIIHYQDTNKIKMKKQNKLKCYLETWYELKLAKRQRSGRGTCKEAKSGWRRTWQQVLHCDNKLKFPRKLDEKFIFAIEKPEALVGLKQHCCHQSWGILRVLRENFEISLKSYLDTEQHWKLSILFSVVKYPPNDFYIFFYFWIFWKYPRRTRFPIRI